MRFWRYLRLFALRQHPRNLPAVLLPSLIPPALTARWGRRFTHLARAGHGAGGLQTAWPCAVPNRCRCARRCDGDSVNGMVKCWQPVSGSDRADWDPFLETRRSPRRGQGRPDGCPGRPHGVHLVKVVPPDSSSNPSANASVSRSPLDEAFLTSLFTAFTADSACLKVWW